MGPGCFRDRCRGDKWLPAGWQICNNCRHGVHEAAIGALDLEAGAGAAGSQMAASVGAASSTQPEWIAVQGVQDATGGATSSNQPSVNVTALLNTLFLSFEQVVFLLRDVLARQGQDNGKK